MSRPLKDKGWVQRLRKTRWYCRWRARLATPPQVGEDWEQTQNAEVVTIQWPAGLRKPTVAIVQDYEACPRWTKYCRFLTNNGFAHGILDLHAHDWLERARTYDLVAGVRSCEPWHLHEIREKYHFLETRLGIRTYPSAADVMLYEDKKLEAYIAAAAGIPFARTFISHERQDALAMLDQITYPCISKVVPSSGSIGVEWVRNRSAAKGIVARAFSPNGRNSHCGYFRQKNYVFFQEYVPNDGYDIRVIVVGNLLFGYYRKVPAGDFRASGMGYVEKRDLPEPAMAIALHLNQFVGSPMLVVDMVHAASGQYVVIEYSPVCQMDTPEQLHVDQVPGAYEWHSQTGFQFRPTRLWLHELALRDFLLHHYLPQRVSNNRSRPETPTRLPDAHPSSRLPGPVSVPD